MMKSDDSLNFNSLDLNVTKINVRLPHELRTHKDFSNAKINVVGDEIHFQLTDLRSMLPELWCFYSKDTKWAKVCFLTDQANPQV